MATCTANYTEVLVMDVDIKKVLHFIAGVAVILLILVTCVQVVDIAADMIRLYVGV